MSEYPKINTLWKRDAHHNIIQGEFSCPEFENIKRWAVSEKVDGTNIRVYKASLSFDEEAKTLRRNAITFQGRTSRASIPAPLVNALNAIFTPQKTADAVEAGDDYTVTLYGEGYGPGIQSCGGNYREDVGFILFDVVVGKHWLGREDVEKIAERLGIPVVPFLGYHTAQEAESLIMSFPASQCSKTPQPMEGIVARADPVVYDQNGIPIMFKLKVKDYDSPK